MKKNAKKKLSNIISKKLEIATLLKEIKSLRPNSFPTRIMDVTPKPKATIYVIEVKLSAI